MLPLVKICRICLEPEDLIAFNSIFEDGGQKAAEIYQICSLKISEMRSLPALLCPRCSINLQYAIQFRTLAINSDEYFMKLHQLYSIKEDLKEKLQEDKLEYAVDCGNLYDEEQKFEQVHRDNTTEIKNQKIIDEEYLEVEALEDISDNDYQLSEASPNSNENTEDYLNDYGAKEKKLIEKIKKPGKLKLNQKYREPRLNCSVCDYVAANHNALSEHMDEIHFKMENDGKTCSYCGRIYLKAKYCKRHIITNHLGVRFECENCGAQFGSLEYLKYHQKVERNQRDFQCDLCSKMFFTYTMLKRHMRSHSNLKAFPCSEPRCGMAFKFKQHLLTHVNVIHKKLKPWKCPECDLRFSLKHHLKGHLKNIHS